MIFNGNYQADVKRSPVKYATLVLTCARVFQPRSPAHSLADRQGGHKSSWSPQVTSEHLSTRSLGGLTLGMRFQLKEVLELYFRIFQM